MKKIVVDKKGEIKSINDALQNIDFNDDNEIVIKNGIYFEKIKVSYKQYNNYKLIIKGEDKEKTIITYNDYAKKIHNDKKEYNTFRTYTMMLLGDNISLSNLTIQNESGDGKIYGQAVALEVIGNNIYLDNLVLKGFQDTLFLGPLPFDLIERYQNFLPEDELIYPKEHLVYVTNCFIEGDVDFVFGGAKAYFINCIFHSKTRDGFVFAPSTEEIESDGFIIINSQFTSDTLIPHVYLARPWRDYGKVVLINSIMGSHIYDIGFDKWNDTNRDQTCRFYEIGSRYTDNHWYRRCSFVTILSEKEKSGYLEKTKNMYIKNNAKH